MADIDLTIIMRAVEQGVSAAVAKVDKAIGRLGTAGHRAGPLLKSLGGHVVNLGKWAAAAAVGGVALLAAGLGFAFKQAVAEEESIKRLDAALRANIKSWNGDVTAVEKVIKSRIRLGFADDQQRDSLARLLGITKDSTKALDLNRLAMDLARFRNIDLATASDIVGKVYGGNIGILSRYGIQREKGATSTEALAAIQVMAAGQAEAYGSTTKGAFEAVQLVIGDLVEDIGTALLPAGLAFATLITEQVIPAVERVAAGFTAWVDENKPLIDDLLRLGATVLSGLVSIILEDLVPAVGRIIGRVVQWFRDNATLIGQIRDFSANVIGAFVRGLKAIFDALMLWDGLPLIVGGVTIAVLALNAAVRANPIVLIAAAIITAIGLLAQAWESDFGGMRTTITAFFDAVARNEHVRNALRVLGAIAGHVGNAFAVIGRVIGILLTKLGQLVRFVQDNMGPLRFLASLATQNFRDIFEQVQGRQHGGSVQRGRPFIVGEAGPEVFVPDANGTIVPNERLRPSTAAFAGIGGQPVVIQLVADGRMLGELVDNRLYYMRAGAAMSTRR